MDFKLTLHTFSAPPSSLLLEKCAELLRKDDSLLLVGEGVYIATENSYRQDLLKNLPCSIYALDEDCLLAGIGHKLSAQIETIDYSGFVKLTESHEKYISWD